MAVEQRSVYEQEIRNAFRFLRDVAEELPDTLPPKPFAAWARWMAAEAAEEFQQQHRQPVPGVQEMCEGAPLPRRVIYAYWLPLCLSAMADLAESWSLPVRRHEFDETIVRLLTITQEHAMSLDGFIRAVRLAGLHPRSAVTWDAAMETIVAAWQDTQLKPLHGREGFC